MISQQIKEIIVLFDEQGTPVFDRNTSTFIGVSLLYSIDDEETIFDSCNEVFGLSKLQPLKNNKAGKTRVVNMAKCIGSLPVFMTVVILDMRDERLQKEVEKYLIVTNEIRTKSRPDVRHRKVAQKLHTDVLVDTIFLVTGLYLKSLFNSNFILYPFMDNWAIPQADRSTILSYQSISLEKRITETSQELNRGIIAHVEPVRLLSLDSPRKRLIDGCAIIVSRAFLDEGSPKYSSIPLEILKSTLGVRFQIGDMTEYEIAFMEKFKSTLHKSR